MTVLRPDVAGPEPIRPVNGIADGHPEQHRSDQHHRGAWAVYQTPPQRPSTATINAPRSAPLSPPLGTPEPALADPSYADAPTVTLNSGSVDSTKLIRLHESIAALLSSRGKWEQAYQHLRSALDLVYADKSETALVPEQLRREVARLRREHAEAREQSFRDSLTASYNRRYLDQRLTSLLAALGTGHPGTGLAVALVDLDWFKRVNDTFGHLVGDRVLQQVVDLLADRLPETAFCARYGGEEFVLVLPSIDATTAVAVAEAARSRIERYPWSRLVPGLAVTVSVGLAFEPAVPFGSDRAPTSAEQQLLRADGLLYAAKQCGRNAVAYRDQGGVRLAGAAANRRSVAQARAVGHR